MLSLNPKHASRSGGTGWGEQGGGAACSTDTLLAGGLTEQVKSEQRLEELRPLAVCVPRADTRVRGMSRAKILREGREGQAWHPKKSTGASVAGVQRARGREKSEREHGSPGGHCKQRWALPKG